MHGGGQTVEDCLADQKMADIEFGDLRQRRDFLRGGEIETVAGMDLKPGACGEPRAAHNARELGGSGSSVAGGQSVAPGACVKFDDRGADRGRSLDLRRLRGNEQRYPDSSLGKFVYRRA